MKRRAFVIAVCALLLLFFQRAVPGGTATSSPSEPPDFSKYKFRRIVDAPPYQHSFVYENDPACFFRVTNDGRMMTTGSGAANIRMWAVPEGKMLAEVCESGRGLASADITPSGKYVVALWHSGSRENESDWYVTIYKSASLEKAAEITWHETRYEYSYRSVVALNDDVTYAFIMNSGMAGVFRVDLPQPTLDEPRIKALIAQLGDESYEKRETAFRALEELGQVALPYLREAVKNADVEIAHRAATLVDECRFGRSVKRIFFPESDFTLTLDRNSDGTILSVITSANIWHWNTKTWGKSSALPRFSVVSGKGPDFLAWRDEPFLRGEEEKRTLEVLAPGGVADDFKPDFEVTVPQANAVCVCENGDYIAFFSASDISLYDVQARKIVDTVRQPCLARLGETATARFGSGMLVVEQPDKIRFYRIKDSKLVEVATDIPHKVGLTQIAPDGKMCAQLTDQRRTLALRSLPDGKVLHILDIKKLGGTVFPTFLGDSTRLFILARFTNIIALYDTVAGKELWQFTIPAADGQYYEYSATADGKRLFLISSFAVQVRDGETGDLLNTITTKNYNSNVHPEGASPDGSVVLFRDIHDYTFYLIDANTGKELWTRPKYYLPGDSPLFSEDSRVIIRGGDGQDILVDAKTGDIILQRAYKDAGLIRWLGTNRAISTGAYSMMILDASTLKVLFSIELPFNPWYSFDLRPVDGWRRILIAPRDGSIWEFAPVKE